MPRYTQVTPTFTPVDYATRIAPLEQYKDEYDKRLDKIEEQGLLADAIGGLIDENTDPELMQVYNDYSTKMQNTAKDLLDSGDLRSNRQSLLELRRDYANKLLPIQQAFNNRAEAAKSFRDAKMKDPSLLGKDPVNTSLSSWMNGKAPDTKTISGNQLYAYGQANAKAASGREFRETAWRLDKNLGNQFFTRIKAEGWNQDEVIQALAGYASSGDKNISKDAKALLDYMVKAKDTIHSMTGVDELGDSNMIAAADRYIIDGFIDGVSYKQEDAQQAYDPYKFETARYNMEAAKYKAKKAQADYEATQNKPKTDRPFRSGSDSYIAKGDRNLIDKATKEFATPINYNGTTLYDAIDAYGAYKRDISEIESLNKKLKDIIKNSEIGNNRMASDAQVHNILMRENQEYADTFNSINELRNNVYALKAELGNNALSDKEYSKLVSITGKTADKFSKQELFNAVQNNIDYAAETQIFNRQKIADDGITKKLKDEIAITIQSEIRGGKKDLIFETKDGYTPSGKAAKVSVKDFEPKDILSIEMSPFTVSSGRVLVKKKDGTQYLVPAYLLGNEGGSDIITAGLMNPDDNTELWNKSLAGAMNSVLYGAHSSDVRSRLELADDKIHDAISAIQRNFLQNHPQAWSTSIVKGQGELPTYIEEE